MTDWSSIILPKLVVYTKFSGVSLTDRQRRIVKLYFFEQLTQQQIADALGIRQQSVTDALRAALKRMRKLF